MTLSSTNTKSAKNTEWQLDDMCDMLYMLVTLRDNVFHSNELDSAFKFRYLYEAVPVITDLMEKIIALDKSLTEQ